MKSFRCPAATLCLAVFMVPACPQFLAAHDMPDEVIVYGFVKPEGQRLDFILRLPLVMFADMDFPKRGPGYLDLTYMDAPLRAAAAAAAQELALFENDSRLRPQIVAARISPIRRIVHEL